MGGVAEERGPAVGPTGERVAIDHRVLVDPLGSPNELPEVVEPGESPAVEGGEELVDLRLAGVVLLVVALGEIEAPLSDPVDRGHAGLVGVGDGVGHELGCLVAAKHHGGAVEVRLGAGGGPPQNTARPQRLTLAGVHLGSDRRVDAVGTDEDRAPNRLRGA